MRCFLNIATLTAVLGEKGGGGFQIIGPVKEKTNCRIFFLVRFGYNQSFGILGFKNSFRNFGIKKMF